MGTLTAYIFDPGLTTTFHLVGLSGAAEFVKSPVGLIGLWNNSHDNYCDSIDFRA
jgi:hypothetical protein